MTKAKVIDVTMANSSIPSRWNSGAILNITRRFDLEEYPPSEMNKRKDLFKAEAEEIFTAFYQHLPAGTLEQLYNRLKLYMENKE